MEGEEGSIPRGREGDCKEILLSAGTDSTSCEVRESLRYLERLENIWTFDPCVKNDIHTLRLMISTLVPFFVIISKWQTEDLLLEIRFKPIASVIEDVIEELQLSGLEVLSNLEKLRRIKPDIGDLYFDFSRSSKLLATGKGEDAVRCLNSLLENLKDILCCEADWILPLKQQFEALEKKLNFFRYFLLFLSKICNLCEYLDDLFAFAEAVAVEAACVLYFLLVEKENEVRENDTGLLSIRPFQPEVKMIYFRALQASRSVIIGPLEPDECVLGYLDSLIHNLRELSNNKSNFEVDLKDQIEIVLEELSSVRCYLIDTPLHCYNEGLDNFMTELLDLTTDIGIFIFSYEELESKQKFGDLMDTVQFLKSASGDFLIPESWQSNFPRTAFINFITTNLKERLKCNIGSGDLLKCEITIIYEELVALRDDFVKITKLHKEDEGLSALFAHCKDVAYQMEYFVDLYVFEAVSLQYIWSGLTDIRESIRQICTEVKAIAKKMASDSLAHSITNDVGVVPSEAIPTCLDAPVGSRAGAGSNKNEATDQLVSLEDEATKIIEQLTRGSKQLNILSIVGMPGIGKTTLANLVYKDPSVTLHFHAQAWCSVSHAYEREALLLKILRQVQGVTEQDRQKMVDLEEQLYKSLKGKRYLVILDDIWEIEVWDDLRQYFPDDENGSRLVFTTRNHEVAFHANSVPCNLRLLSDEDSWKLLQVKVFEKETCPPKLFGIGKRIAESCKGLPLAVVLIAGLLKTTEGNRDCWERVHNQLRSYVVDYRPGQQLGTLELSYMHLPHCLKPCFLYFSAFAEDAEIPARKLVRLWIAEGFVQPPKIKQNSLEYEAENYLNALIDRSLVIVAKRSSTGGVKACRIHDLLHEFCLVRAKEDRFLMPVSRYDAIPIYFRISEMHEQYRLSIRCNRIPSVKMGHFVPRVRTLLFSRISLPEIFFRHGYPDWLHGIDFMNKFRLLRVLDLGGVDSGDELDLGVVDSGDELDLEGVDSGDENFLIAISQLVHLRYLAVEACILKIPIEVANLKNLETFFLTTGSSQTDVLAETICSMVSLRHLLIDGDLYFRFDSAESFQKLPKLENFTILSTPALYCDKDIEKMMRNLPNLQKLKCKFLDSWDPLKRCNQFPVLDFLDRLESLKVFFSGKGLYPCNLSFPLSIKKLTLYKSRLPWDEISIIGRLPKLEVLKLLYRAFEGREWDMKDGEFQKLKFLELRFLDIKIWNATSEQLPCLEQLVLDWCSDLEEIPPAFGETPTLRMINMNQGKPSAMDSVKQIEKEQHDMGNDQFNVFISCY